MVELKDQLKIYQGKKVFITGHTGFKGSWLVEYLNFLGATIKGYSLKPNTEESHFNILKSDCETVFADIRDLEKLKVEIGKFKPDIIFHLAAQPLVRESYLNPVENYSTNMMGVVNLFESARRVDSIRAIVNVTTDKCYENKEWVWGYRESEAMGGYDPYSASKACSELITSSYRNSYFNLDNYKIDHNCLIATARAGNVIGGGDWSQNRIVPDIIRSILKKESLMLRNPSSTRPWQHVLEPLTGYLFLGEKLLKGEKKFADAWNFGPNYNEVKTVKELVEIAKNIWNVFDYKFEDRKQFHEAGLLKLDSTKANEQLEWKGSWNSFESIYKTIEWYKDFYANKSVITKKQLKEYVELI